MFVAAALPVDCSACYSVLLNYEEIGDVFILTKDNKTLCYTAEYAAYGVFGFAGLVIFVVGVPMLFFILLWKARNNGIQWNLKNDGG